MSLHIVLVTGTPASGRSAVLAWLADATPAPHLVADPDGDEAAWRAAGWDGTDPVLTSVPGDRFDPSRSDDRVAFAVANPIVAVTRMLDRSAGAADKEAIEEACGRYRSAAGIVARVKPALVIDFDRVHDGTYRDALPGACRERLGLDPGAPFPYLPAAVVPPLGAAARNFVHRFVGKEGWADYERLRELARAALAD